MMVLVVLHLGMRVRILRFPCIARKTISILNSSCLLLLFLSSLYLQWLSPRVFHAFSSSLFFSLPQLPLPPSSLVFSERRIRARGGSSGLRTSPCCPRHGVRLPHVLLSLDVFGNKIVLSIPTALLPPSHLPPKKLWREKGKNAKFWAPHPSGLHPSGLHPSGLQPSGLHFFQVLASTLRAPPFGAQLFLGLGLGPPPFGGPTLCGPKRQHPKIGRSRNWPKSNWPKSKKKAGRSRNWPKSIALAKAARGNSPNRVRATPNSPKKISFFFFFMLIVKAKLGIGARPNLKILRLLAACTMEEEISDTCLKRRTKFLESGSHFPSFGRAHLQSGRFANHTFHVIHTEEALVF